MPDLNAAVAAVLEWPVDHAAAAVVAADGAVLATAGEQDRVFALASVTKPLSAYAVLVAIEEGAVEWDTPAGPGGSTVRHLAAHASGLPFAGGDVQAQPDIQRIYSNAGFEVLGATIADASGIAFADYLREAVLAPLGMAATRLAGSPGAGAVASCADLARFAAELQAPTLVHPSTLAGAVEVAFPGLDGVLPGGYGRQKADDWSSERSSGDVYAGQPWGLGFEIRGHKWPHWTGLRSSPRTFGHFGQTGTFMWVDPDAGAAAVVLTDRDFGEWAKTAWPPWTDSVLAALRDVMS